MLIQLFNSLYKNIFVFICLIFSLNVSAENHSSPKSIAFYYQHVDSVRELLVYDRVVLTPSAIFSAMASVAAVQWMGRVKSLTLSRPLVKTYADRRSWEYL